MQSCLLVFARGEGGLAVDDEMLFMVKHYQEREDSKILEAGKARHLFSLAGNEHHTDCAPWGHSTAYYCF